MAPSSLRGYISFMTERIISTPGIRSGKPCIAGTRITVRDMLQYMAGGDSIETLLDDFSALTREDLLACLAYAARTVDSPVALAAE